MLPPILSPFLNFQIPLLNALDRFQSTDTEEMDARFSSRIAMKCRRDRTAELAYSGLLRQALRTILTLGAHPACGVLRLMTATMELSKKSPTRCLTSVSPGRRATARTILVLGQQLAQSHRLQSNRRRVPSRNAGSGAVPPSRRNANLQRNEDGQSASVANSGS